MEAMIKEMNNHTNQGHWQITNKAEMKTKGYKHKPIMSIWSFKQKEIQQAK